MLLPGPCSCLACPWARRHRSRSGRIVSAMNFSAVPPTRSGHDERVKFRELIRAARPRSTYPQRGRLGLASVSRWVAQAQRPAAGAWDANWGIQSRRDRRRRRCAGVLREPRHYRDTDRRDRGPRAWVAGRARTVRGRVCGRGRRVGAHDGAAGGDATAPRAGLCERGCAPAQRAPCAHARRQLDRRACDRPPCVRHAAQLGHRGAHGQRGLDAHGRVAAGDGRGQSRCRRGGRGPARAGGVADHSG
jgi:hypothetical protein